MLTATYSIVAISAEQNNARKILVKLQHSITNVWKNLHEIDFSRVELIIHKLMQFDKIFHARKLERYLIPAIKNATHEIDPLLAELESLNAFCVRILQTLPQQLHSVVGHGLTKKKELHRAMDLYCSSLQLRLAKEDAELLPLVHQVLSGEEIFDVGAKILTDDGEKYVAHQTDFAASL